MTLEAHWEGVYRSKRPDEVSWFTPHLETSLALIKRTGVSLDAPIIVVGGGASTLVDDLLASEYRDVTVLDVSHSALDVARSRLGVRSSRVTWLVDDVTCAHLPREHFAVWHDRAVFHFLINAEERERYVAQVRHAVVPGGHVIVATFGPEGPLRCSGLTTSRYDAEELHTVFGEDFEMIDRREEWHQTPAGGEQQFIYCL